MKHFARAERVAEQIRRDLAELVRFELKDPRVGMVSLTAVEVTPDYAHAKVYFSTLNQSDAQQAQSGLSRASGFLRRELGKRICLHTLPQLHFIHDNSIENGEALSRLIENAMDSSRKNQQENNECHDEDQGH